MLIQIFIFALTDKEKGKHGIKNVYLEQTRVIQAGDFIVYEYD
jgi:hypothetical protein